MNKLIFYLRTLKKILEDKKAIGLKDRQLNDVKQNSPVC